MEPVTFTTSDGVRLEGELRRPEGTARGSAVICHPHPRHGGSKDHPILWALRNELAGRHGLVVLSFNFRGVMGSEGTYGGGRDELADVHAGVDLARNETPGRPTILCGWSFGANVVLRAAMEDDRAAALVLYGIPLRPSDLELPPTPKLAELQTLRRPVLLITGDGDTYCPPEAARAFASEFPDAELILLEGTDHYLWRREHEAAARAGSFVEGVLPPPRDPRA